MSRLGNAGRPQRARCAAIASVVLFVADAETPIDEGVARVRTSGSGRADAMAGGYEAMDA
jgi:hypothetical protein